MNFFAVVIVIGKHVMGAMIDRAKLLVCNIRGHFWRMVSQTWDPETLANFHTAWQCDNCRIYKDEGPLKWDYIRDRIEDTLI